MTGSTRVGETISKILTANRKAIGIYFGVLLDMLSLTYCLPLNYIWEMWCLDTRKPTEPLLKMWSCSGRSDNMWVKVDLRNGFVKCGEGNRLFLSEFTTCNYTDGDMGGNNAITLKNDKKPEHESSCPGNHGMTS